MGQLAPLSAGSVPTVHCSVNSLQAGCPVRQQLASMDQAAGGRKWSVLSVNGLKCGWINGRIFDSRNGAVLDGKGVGSLRSRQIIGELDLLIRAGIESKVLCQLLRRRIRLRNGIAGDVSAAGHASLGAIRGQVQRGTGEETAAVHFADGDLVCSLDKIGVNVDGRNAAVADQRIGVHTP